MVRMIYLSERLPVEENGLRENVDIFRWNRYPDIPRLSDYEIAVLDMKTTYGKYGVPFWVKERNHKSSFNQEGL